jgi:hypothetical protein
VQQIDPGPRKAAGRAAEDSTGRDGDGGEESEREREREGNSASTTIRKSSLGYAAMRAAR